MIKIPPQGRNLMSATEIESAKTKGQAFVIGNIVLRTFFQQAMSMLFGSILMI